MTSTFPIYLDYNGTTPHDPAVIGAMRPFIDTEFGNPSSSHWYGIAPKQAVNRARGQVADLLGCRPAEVVFTSGGTESNNHAIAGVARALRDRGRHIVTTAVEHPAVLAVCRDLETRGWSLTVVPVDGLGRVDATRVAAAFRPDTILVSVMHANNEVGTVQPVAEIAALAHQRGILVHTDAAQSVGKIPVNVDDLGVDLLSVAGHKVYAPKGIGALYIRENTPVTPFCRGAGQEGGRRAGTENVPWVVGLGAACAIAGRVLPQAAERMGRLRDRLWDKLSACRADVQINGHPTERLPNTLSVSFKNLEANRILEEIGLDVAASAGAACHADTVEISHVLQALEMDLGWAKGTLRFSVGRPTTKDEIDRAAEVVRAAVARLSLQASR
ncbi:MAG: aminotransferase class V-fold PLP-dependent enzyme [Desulfobacterales bacterium]|jgi:cysteine desulfurase|nr:aminotransferase class V-fold PLP-dependent enzyme [Desulfobacterales bacterium]